MTVATPHVRAGRTAAAASVRLGLLLLFFGWMASLPAAAQVPDSVDTGGPIETADSVRTADPVPTADSTITAVDAAVSMGEWADSLRAARMQRQRLPVGFEDAGYGAAITDTLPVKLGAIDLSELLGNLPGSFLYRFDTPGWPDGWSRDGRPPQRSTLTLNEIPFNHLFTGRPGFDIAPLAFIESPRLAANRFDRPGAVSTRLRSFASPRPLTELKFWKGGAGLESIDVVHAQHRRMSMFGSSGFLNVMGTYSGRSADGDYPGSELHRGRQVQLRLRYEQPGWSAEIHEMNSRRTVGAHGGVIPAAGDFDTVYEPFGAVVENPNATRRLIRNDLVATARLSWFGSATTLGAFWSSETFRYRDGADTLGASSDRIGVRLRQPLPGGPVAFAEAWADRIDPTYRYAAAPLRRTEVHAAIRDSLDVLGWTASASVSAHAYDSHVHGGGSLEIARDTGWARWNGGLSVSGQPASPVEQMGFLAMGISPNGRPGREIEMYTELMVRGGVLDVTLRGFGARTARARDIYMITDYQAVPDSAAVIVAPESVRRFGATADLGWRRDAERGIYALAQPSFVLFAAGESELHERLARSLPTVFGRARVGARYLLFEGDLDLDAYVEAFGWSRTTGRALHPETGLLAVPLEGAMEFGPSAMLNVGAEAGVRDAVFFVSYRNVLSGTALMAGNLIVPVYPLPAQRLRFGVYWPIFD